MQVFSAHQMGSCRMSANSKDGPIQSTGESYECENLYVADASLFPTSLGINPMITVGKINYLIILIR
jgi:long-chain-alcohol oxidase